MDLGRIFSKPNPTVKRRALRGGSLAEVLSKMDTLNLKKHSGAKEITFHAFSGDCGGEK